MRRTFCFSRSWRPYPTVFFIFLFFPCCPGMKLRFSIAHFSEKQRSPLRNSFIPSRRHSRQTGPMYLAIKILSAYYTRASYSPFFGRPASVVGDGGAVLDRAHFETSRGQGANGRLAAGAGAADTHVDDAQA